MPRRGDEGGSKNPPSLLSIAQAAVHLGIGADTYCKLQKIGIFSPGGVTRVQLDDILAELFANGLPWPVPIRKSQWRGFPYTQPVWTEIQGGPERLHARWRHNREHKSIHHPFGSASWIQEWFACERRYASQDVIQPTERDTTHLEAQPQPGTGDDTPVLVTRSTAGEAREEVPYNRTLRIRRRAAVIQADIARIIRAAKQAGATRVEVRLNDSSTVVIRLEGENALADSEEIVL